MSIENTLERIATALETLAGKPAAPAAAPAAEAPARAARKPKEAAPPPPPPDPVEVDPFADESGMDAPELKEVTEADVRAAMVSYRKKHGDGPALSMFKKVGGAETLKSLPKDKYRAVYEAAMTGA